MKLFSKSSGDAQREGEATASPSLSVQTLVCRGQNHEHKDFCHDFLIHHETDQFFVGAILDGSSGGVHSQFASGLFGKVFNLLLRVKGHLDNIRGPREPRDTAKYLMHEFCERLAVVQHELGLANNELLSTILLAVYSKPLNKLYVVAFGDGYIHVNGQGIKLKNTRYGDTEVNGVLMKGENKPDYIIEDVSSMMERYVEHYFSYVHPDDEAEHRDEYHRITGDIWKIFNEWYLSKPSYEFTDVRDFSIASDGIFTFQSGIVDVSDEAIELLLNSTSELYGGKESIALQRKANLLSFKKRGPEDTHPYKLSAFNQDDLSIIRVIINDPVEA